MKTFKIDGAIWRWSLILFFCIAMATSYRTAWIIVCALLIRACLRQYDRAELLETRSVGEADPIVGDADRVSRVNEKLRDRCLALEKQNTELQSELNKRDRIIPKTKVKQKGKAA